jgi:chaperonin GroES
MYKSMNFKPLHAHVVVKPTDAETTTKSGILLPSQDEKPQQGEVVAIGTGRITDAGQVIPLTVKVGDKVMFKKYSPDEVKIDGQDYLVIKEQDIMLILE